MNDDIVFYIVDTVTAVIGQASRMNEIKVIAFVPITSCKETPVEIGSPLLPIFTHRGYKLIPFSDNAKLILKKILLNLVSLHKSLFLKQRGGILLT